MPQKIIGENKIGSFSERLSSTKKQEAYKVSFVAPDAKILVVDDNEMNLLVATSLLKATKIQVDTAISGMSALKKMAETHYDIIFLDQMMPSLDGIQTFKMAQEMQENKSRGVPTVALTANAISGAREMFLKEGFTDYLSKPINARQFEEMLVEYLPLEKIHSPENNSEAKIETKESKEENYKYLNVELGLDYSAEMEDVYKSILEMFCNLKNEKQKQLNETFENEDWQNYTILIHALKSTSLQIGGEKCSESAKNLEIAGKMIISDSSSELEKHESIEYIQIHHGECMKLYDQLVEEGKRYLETNDDK